MKITLNVTDLGRGTLDTETLRFSPNDRRPEDPANGFAASEVAPATYVHGDRGSMTPEELAWIDAYIVRTTVADQIAARDTGEVGRDYWQGRGTRNWKFGSSLKTSEQLDLVKAELGRRVALA